MNKKLLAVAVAGALAAPLAALAQSSVTISGKAIMTVGNFKLGNFNPTLTVAGAPVQTRGATPGNSSETMVKDESSRVIFEVREDLGGGLAAIAKWDLRASPDVGAVANSGESYVGLTSKNWGTLTLGRHDLHYGNHASFSGVHLGLQTNPTAVFDRAAGGLLSVANQTRTANVIRYGSPKFGNMFEVVVAYSANSATGTQEADVGSTARKGSAWALTPKLYGANWEVAYSYWSDKPDARAISAFAPVAAAGAIALDKVRGDSLYGWYKWGGLRVGLAWNKSKADATVTAAGSVLLGAAAPGAAGNMQITNRTTWGIPIAYNWGSHNVYFDWYKARSDKASAWAGADTKANFLNIAYAYDLSKRTSAGVSYTRINNGRNAQYGFFSQQQAYAGSAAAFAPAGAVAPGEDPRFMGVTLQHRF